MLLRKLFWLPMLALAACSSGGGPRNTYDKSDSEPATYEAAKADSVTTGSASKASEAARKIIHTADFHCKVANVFTATTRLEQLVSSAGGMVQESSIDNSNNEIKTCYYKPDSLRQSQTYTTTSFLVLRVPSFYIDSVINAIPGLVSFIDSRKLKQNDVTLAYLENELKNRNTIPSARALQLAKKSSDAIDAEQYEDDRRSQNTDRKISNLQLMDNVSYATITVAFSQPEQVYTQIIVNPEHVERPPFLLQCRAGLSNGCDIVRVLVVGLINIWPLLLLAFALRLIYRKFWRRQPA